MVDSAEEDLASTAHGKMLVKTGTVSLGLPQSSFDDSTRQIEKTAASVAGNEAYIETQSASKRSVRMTLRVPVRAHLMK